MLDAREGESGLRREVYTARPVPQLRDATPPHRCPDPRASDLVGRSSNQGTLGYSRVFDQDLRDGVEK